MACSGLGHVARGNEAWAADLVPALRRAGVAVRLFGGAAVPGGTTIWCPRRTDRAARTSAALFRRLGGWRYSMGSDYEVEQTGFALALLPRLRRFDIVHLQDPTAALLLHRAWRLGLSRARVILADGTGAAARVLRRFSFLQFLTPEAEMAWRAGAPVEAVRGQRVFMVPNFVDASVFAPGDRRQARAAFGLPQDATILLCAAAIRRTHKRVDHLIEAVSRLDGTMLVVAGGREAETDEVIAFGRSRLGERVVFLPDLPRARMPALYRAADAFVLGSLAERFGIVLIEAMASGLPLIAHDAPGFRWIAGDAGLFVDMTREDCLFGALDAARTRAPAATREAARFSADAVIPRIRQMYAEVMAAAS